MKLCTLVIAGAFVCSPAYAWDGWDGSSGANVEIERGTLVRPGENIEYYDYSRGEYRSVEVESIRQYGSSVEVEVFDSDAGEYRILDMDK